MNRTLIGNKARYQTERQAWIDLALMQEEARFKLSDAYYRTDTGLHLVKDDV